MYLPIRLACLVSGGGTTMAAIIKECQRGGMLDGLIMPVLVICGKPGIGAAKLAQNLGVAKDNILEIVRGRYRRDKHFGEAILNACNSRQVDLIGQYGWLSRTPENVIARFQDHMINQHPGPLDPGRLDFGGRGMFGRRVHFTRMLFVKMTDEEWWTEAVAQRVDPEYDRGAILHFERVRIDPDDEVESLQKRVLAVEHRVQIEALRQMALGELRTYHRAEPLVREKDITLLRALKKLAELAYPHG